MVKPMSASSSRFALFSNGFRPFFLGGAIWAMIAMLLWIALLTGQASFATQYGAVAWHAHEFLFGYGSAIVVGFMLTTIPNWTGRLPVSGTPLFALFTVWSVGRIAMLSTDIIGFVAAACVDSSFLLGFSAIVWREIIVGRNWRNLKMALILTVLALVNIAFHAEVHLFGQPLYAIRATASLLAILIMLIGGRIVPSFTRNWLAKRQGQPLPTPFNAFDRYALGCAGASLGIWVIFPDRVLTAAVLILSALLQSIRLARWVGLHSWREPLVLILHVGYAFIPLGFVAVGISTLWPQTMPPATALHTWTAGAVGVMTLAVMTRTTRGHSGRSLTSPPTTTAIYLLAVLSVILRLATAVLVDWTTVLLELAATAWVAAFLAFVVLYGPMLLWTRAKR
jgi:uncharacterized protein involved in response to NO